MGTYGVLDHSVFKPVGTLSEDFGISVQDITAKPKLSFEYKSSGVSEMVTKVNAPGHDVLSVKTDVNFKSSGSIFFRLKNCVYHSIGNLSDVNRSIMTAFAERRWRGGFVFVHGFYEAGATTIAVSSSANARLSFEGDLSSDLTGSDPVHAGVTIGSKENLAFQVVAESGHRPLLCLSKIRARDRLTALLGGSSTIIHSMLVADAVDYLQADNDVLRLSPEISPERALELGISVNNLYHVAELE